MKLSIFALLAGSAAAFTAPTMTFAVGKKKAPVAKKAAPKKAAPKKVRICNFCGLVSVE